MNPLPPQSPAAARAGDLQEARIRWAAGDGVGAWILARAALDHRPFHPEAWWLLAELAEALGAGDTARECYAQARTLAPALPTAKPGIPVATPSPWSAAAPQLTLPLRPHAPRLTVCLIVRNEAEFIQPCLHSIRDLAWQIVVVDTGSTDGTPEMARQLGAEVHACPWTQDFSAARNAALLQARGDWILMLDADEELAPEAGDLLRHELLDPGVMAYRLPMVDVGRERAGRYYVPRLFRNAPGLFYTGRIHEQIFPRLEPLRRRWGLANCLGKSLLRHHGYSPELTRARQKGERNLELLHLALKEQPADANLRLNLGLELSRAGRPEAALREYQQAYQLLAALPEDQISPELRETLLTQFATRLLGAGQFSDVVRLLQSPLARAGGLTASHHYLQGLAHLQGGHPREAVAAFQACLAQRHEPSLSPAHQEIHGAAPGHCLAICLQTLGQTEAAEAAFRASLEDDPKSARVRLDWAAFLARQSRLADALGELCRLVQTDPDNAAAWELGGRLMVGHAELSELAEEWTAEAFARFPHHPLIARQRQQANPTLPVGDTPTLKTAPACLPH